MFKITLQITLLALGLATACQPRPAPTDPSRASGPRIAPADDSTAQNLARKFTHRARRCFAQVFVASQGRDLTPKERQDTARRDRALVRLGAELRSCLTGSGYGGEAMVSESTVQRWLKTPDCANFARTAVKSRACFALAGVVDQMGYRATRPRPRPGLASTGGPNTFAAMACTTPDPPTPAGRYGASHILIFYQGAKRAPRNITRSKAAARKLALRIAALARAPGASFSSLAKRWSEGPSSKRGGRLGPFLPTQMVPPFSKAVMRLCIGSISGAVETVFGFHVIRRDQP